MALGVGSDCAKEGVELKLWNGHGAAFKASAPLGQLASALEVLMWRLGAEAVLTEVVNPENS